jgi:hypothetical protein
MELAVAALGRLAEGATSAFKTYLEPSYALLDSAIQDSSARVQYQAIQMLGRLSVLFPDQVFTITSVYLSTFSVNNFSCVVL